MKRINLLSSPRNLSTALMYSFAQRKDTKVLDEPFYAHYLKHAKVQHPGMDEVKASMSSDATTIIDSIVNNTCDASVLFIKNMSAHMLALDTTFLEYLTNIIYIRNPKSILNSYAKVAQNPTAAELGTERQVQLFDQLKKKNLTPVVLDSGELLKNPASVLKQLCAVCQIPWMDCMLSWPAGPRPEDGVWAKYWYKNVHASTGFKQQNPIPMELPQSLQSIYHQLKPSYDYLFNYAIKA